MVNVRSINGVNACTSVAIAIVTSSSTRREKSNNGRTYCHENCNKELFKRFVLHT